MLEGCLTKDFFSGNRGRCSNASKGGQCSAHPPAPVHLSGCREISCLPGSPRNGSAIQAGASLVTLRSNLSADRIIKMLLKLREFMGEQVICHKPDGSGGLGVRGKAGLLSLTRITQPLRGPGQPPLLQVGSPIPLRDENTG